jgi:hypothetical protein
MMRVCALLALVAVGRAAGPPALPIDWTSIEEDFMVVYQGQYTQNGDDYCCNDQNCEVQTQYQSGHNYFDYTHNRTRFDDPAQGSIVSLFYPIYKEMAVDDTNTCTSYCPIEDDLEPYALDANSTDEGQKIVRNITTELWEYKEMAFGVIVMETDDVYVDQSKTPAIPIQEIDYLTPFGEAIGQSTSTYLSFIPGTPSPSHFDVKGIDACPQDSGCDQQMRQFVRRRNRSWKTWLKSYQRIQANKSLINKKPLFKPVF